MKRLLPWLLGAASGLVLALALPGWNLWPLLLLFPGLLLEGLDRIDGRWRPLLLGWLGGTVHWAVATNWVVPVMHHYGGLPSILAVGCLVAMAAILGVLWALAAALVSLVSPARRMWLFPALWVLVQVAPRFPPFGFPWNETASALAGHPHLLRSLPVWGASGLGWALVAVGSGLWGLTRRELRRTAAAVVGVAAALAVSLSLVAPDATPAGDVVRVAVIQPGTSLEEKWDPSQWREIADRVWSLTRSAAARGAGLVLWPESAVPFSIESDPEYRAAVESLARELGVDILLNSVGALEEGGYTNSAYLVSPLGLSPARYDKVHLVPFGEFVPGWARFAFTEALVREVGNFTPGAEPTVVPARAPVGVAICFEVVFPDLVTAEVRAGAEVLATLTNDGWYGFSWAPRQHFAQVVLRAAENRRFFARAALTGISAVIDPHGRVVARLAVGDSGLLVEDVQPMTGLTPRARWGDWWAVLCVISAVVILASSWWTRRSSGEGKEVKS
jgi:apolipoprotein N-acyltransferase